MLGFVLLDDSSARLVLQKPKQWEQFRKHRNGAAEWSAPDRPTACDEFVQFSQARYPVPKTIPCRECDVPDVAHHDGHGAERAGFEGRPERMIFAVAARQLSQNVELCVGDGRRAKPSWRGFFVRLAISSESNNSAIWIGKSRAVADVSSDMRLPSQCPVLSAKARPVLTSGCRQSRPESFFRRRSWRLH